MLFLEGIPMRESLVANHHDQGRRQDATAIIECFSVTHTSKNFEGAGERLCSLKGGACAAAQWHNGQSKPGSTVEHTATAPVDSTSSHTACSALNLVPTFVLQQDYRPQIQCC